jgi:hypothetical protein
MNTPKAFANSSPGFEHRENPGTAFENPDQTLKGLGRGSMTIDVLIPWLSLRSNPGLKLANAFCVFIQFQSDALLSAKKSLCMWHLGHDHCIFTQLLLVPIGFPAKHRLYEYYEDPAC